MARRWMLCAAEIVAISHGGERVSFDFDFVPSEGL